MSGLHSVDKLTYNFISSSLSLSLSRLSSLSSSELYLADVAGALFSSALICGTMLPFSIYTGKILLQVNEHSTD